MRQHWWRLAYTLLVLQLFFGGCIKQNMVQAATTTQSFQIANNKARLEEEKLQLENRKLQMDIEKLNLENKKLQREIEQNKAQLEIDKLQLENHKLQSEKGENISQLEANKVKVETEKLQMENYYHIRVLGVFSIIGAAFAFLLTKIWTDKSQKNQERANLQLKAAELLFASFSKPSATHRLQLLQKLFGARLGPGFSKGNFDADLFPGTRVYEMKSALFQELESKADKPGDLMAIWREMFPATDTATNWRRDLANRLAKLVSHEIPAKAPAAAERLGC